MALYSSRFTHGYGAVSSQFYRSVTGKLLCSSIKGKVKKKNFSRGWNFSTFAAHLIEQDLF
jgi:hypothetical protein